MKITEGKIFMGKVTSVTPKTITVLVESKTKHPIYKKTITRTKKYRAHDEKNLAKLDDIVEITNFRPMSATKRFILVRIKKIENKSKRKSTARKYAPKVKVMAKGKKAVAKKTKPTKMQNKTVKSQTKPVEKGDK